jgi:hypothetical protein
MKPYAIALPTDLIIRLDAVAAATDRSRSHIVRSLIEAGFAVTHSPGAAMSGQSTNYDQLRRDQLRRDQLAEAARAIAARIQPKPADTNKDKSQ